MPPFLEVHFFRGFMIRLTLLLIRFRDDYETRDGNARSETDARSCLQAVRQDPDLICDTACKWYYYGL